LSIRRRRSDGASAANLRSYGPAPESLSQLKHYEAGTSQPTLKVLRKLDVVIGVSTDVLLFDQDERGPDEDLKLQFEVLSALSPKEKQVAKAVLEAMIAKSQFAGALDRVKQPAAKAKKCARRCVDTKE
jgi:transcriptional regulator with XRE-family HTH domain